jgi:hypothetical protein
VEDYLEIFKQHKDINEMVSLISEVQELRNDYNQGKYAEMQQLINRLTAKYFVETCLWNSVNPVAPVTYKQAYLNGEDFLRLIGFKILLQNGVDVMDKISETELTQIKTMIKPLG